MVTSLTIPSDAESFTLGPGETHFQLELTTLISPYIYVQRTDRSKIVLLPDGNPVKCYVLSHGDTIHFLGSKTSILINMKSKDVQVASSPVQEPTVTANVTSDTITSLALSAVATPDMSIPLEQVTETPMNDTIAESDAGDEHEDSRLPSVNTIVHPDSRKRSREDVTSEEESKPKKSRKDVEDEEVPEVSSNICPTSILKRVY